MWVKCLDCEEFFHPEDCDHRDPVLEDCLRPWDKVDICPYCKSDELVEVETCAMCGGPIRDGSGSAFCEECRDEIDYWFNDLFEKFPGESLHVKKLIFDRAEEVNWYGAD